MKKIFLVIACCCCLCGCNNNDKINVDNNNDVQSNEQKTQKQTEQQNQEIEKEKFKMGDDLIVTTDDGDYKIKFTKVTETDERNQFSDIIANRVIIVEYEYENISLTDDLYISDMDFKLYDKDNNYMESYPSTKEKFASAISAGRKATASEAFALNNSNNYIELEFYDNIFSNSLGTIILEW